jgi:two-component sensor histidine kinase
MSTVSRFPNSLRSQNASRDTFESEVAARFGLVPNFFRSAPDAPFVPRELWQFAKSAYLDTPMPTLFKERLFVYLSRFCEVRYCVTRHCGFLLGLGRAAGDPAASTMTMAQVIRLLKRPVTSDEHADAALSRIETIKEPIEWPTPETSNDDDVLTLVTVLFLRPARANREKDALRTALGAEKFELLIAFLTFIRSAHYWTLMHPEIAFEDDVKSLLREHKELARLLLEDSEADHCETGARLSAELESLRVLDEREELENAKRALEESGRQKDLPLREVDHRIRNSLQVVSSVLHLQARTAGPAASQFHAAAARVAAIAMVHKRLYKYGDVGSVELDRYLIDLCHGLAAASGSASQGGVNISETDPVIVNADMAVSVGLIVNELVTNAIKHSGPIGEGGEVRVSLRATNDCFSISVLDSGEGPIAAQALPGLGTQIVETLARQIEATITRERLAPGYKITVMVPLHAGSGPS